MIFYSMELDIVRLEENYHIFLISNLIESLGLLRH
jgi:hypothetical protein